MSIPSFDPETGNLPPGIHEATWSEFTQRFGFSARRQALLVGLRRALDVFAQVGCRRVYIDGSFVTSKEDPGDYDGCWDERGVDGDRLLALAPVFLDQVDLWKNGRRKQKAAYGGELFVASQRMVDGQTFLEFFQSDKETGALKGIVLLTP